MASQLIDRKTAKLLVGIIFVGTAIFIFGHGQILDAKFFYSGEFAQLYFSLLSPDQASAYLRGAILDLIFIHFYSSLIWLEFARLVGQSKLRVVALTPAALDLIETISIIMILLTGKTPSNLDWLGFVTAAKWTTGAVVFLGWLLLFANRRRHAHRRL